MGQRELLVETALGQRDAENGRKFVRWYNQASGRSIGLDSAWCAIFVSWCARQVGISEEEIPVFSGCTAARRWFKKRGRWRERDYVPRRGDLVLFDWDGDPSCAEHVGIVTGVDGSWVRTVEGNAGTPGKVMEKRYPKGRKCILGYCLWEEKEEEDLTREETSKLIDEAVGKAREELAQAMDEKLKAAGTRMYATLEDVPAWGRGTVSALMVTGRLRGNEKGELNLSHDLLRALVIMERGETACR